MDLRAIIPGTVARYKPSDCSRSAWNCLVGPVPWVPESVVLFDCLVGFRQAWIDDLQDSCESRIYHFIYSSSKRVCDLLSRTKPEMNERLVCIAFRNDQDAIRLMLSLD